MHRATSFGAKAMILGGLSILAGWQLVSREGTSASDLRTVPLQVGDRVPSVQVFDLESKEASKLPDLVGRGCHIVYVFDPACTACQAGAPDWSDVAIGALGDEGIVWLSIGATEESSRLFLRDADVRFPAYFVSPDARPLGIGSIPGVWAVRDGVIAFRQAGRSSTAPAALAEAFEDRGGWCAGPDITR